MRPGTLPTATAACPTRCARWWRAWRSTGYPASSSLPRRQSIGASSSAPGWLTVRPGGGRRLGLPRLRSLAHAEARGSRLGDVPRVHRVCGQTASTSRLLSRHGCEPGSNVGSDVRKSPSKTSVRAPRPRRPAGSASAPLRRRVGPHRAADPDDQRRTPFRRVSSRFDPLLPWGSCTAAPGGAAKIDGAFQATSIYSIPSLISAYENSANPLDTRLISA